MTDEQPEVDGSAVSGWMLRADPQEFDAVGTLDRYGQVFWFPLPSTGRAELLAPGQPCYLYSAATSRVMGVWAVGEVVAPVLALPNTSIVLAEVELLALAKPIAVTKLRADTTLAEAELFAAPDQPNPLVLRRQELRALESFDFELVEPTEDQRRLADRVLEGDPAEFLA